MPISFFNRLYFISRSQGLLILSQILGAAPVILVTAYLSNRFSLATVADFTFLIGVSAVIFTLSTIGLRARLVLDQFRDFSEADFYCLRILATVPMVLIIFTSGILVGASVFLTIAVVFWRAGDAALDLAIAVDQVRREEQAHTYTYLNGSTFKVVSILTLLFCSELTKWIDPFAALALASSLYSIYAWGLFLSLCEDKRGLFRTGFAASIFRLFKSCLFLAFAQITCALLTAAPRLALPFIEDKSSAGVSAVALSVSTFFGMAFYAVWLRWLPKFGRLGLRSRMMALFGLETTVLLILIVAVLWAVGAPTLGIIFGLEELEQMHAANSILSASAVYFFVMSFANLFKPSRFQFGESLIYLGGILGVLLFVFKLGDWETTQLLYSGTLGMLYAAVSILGFSTIVRRSRS